MNLLVFDFGGTSIKYSLWNKHTLINDVASFPTPKSWQETKEQLLKIKAHFETNYELAGAAFSFPGCVDHESGMILGYSAIKYIHHFPIQKELSELLELPVAMENDANCAALAEVWSGVAKNYKNMLFVVVGTGVGGAVVVDGKIHSGSHLYGGEWGFMYLNYDGQFRNQTLSGLGTAVWMAHRYCERINVPRGTYSGADVFEFAKQGDTNAIKEVETFYKYLSIGLFNLQMSFDPEVIVIGGGISNSKEIVVELENRVNCLLKDAHINDFKTILLPCAYANDANLIGAVKNFIDRSNALVI
jgi:predicted NBD/HSP70 family sugar kinase